MGDYLRTELKVEALKYEPDSKLEDGFELWTKVVTNGWIVTDGLIKVTRNDGSVVCPFIKTRRGITFVREGDYIIIEEDAKHVCGEDKFLERYKPLS